MKNLFMPLPSTLPERFDAQSVDAAKGILILLVIFGHASNFWTPEPFATFSIKFFHVACFLLFPFIYDVKKPDLAYCRDRFIRYYVPFAVFLIGYAGLYLLLIRGFGDVAAWLKDLGLALTIANAPMLDAASGLRALWFLPMLLALVFMNAFAVGTQKISLWFLLLAGFALHASVGMIEAPEKFYLPFGFVGAAYLLWLGIVIRAICTYARKEKLQKFSYGFLALSLAGICAAYVNGSLIKFPVLAFPSAMNIGDLIVHDIIIVSMFLFLITASLFKNIKPLRWFGQNSLVLYLSHLLFLALSMQIMIKNFDVSVVNVETALIVIGIFIFSLAGSVISTIILNKLPALKAVIMPQDWNSWIVRKKKL